MKPEKNRPGRTGRVTVILPVFNEEAGLRGMLPGLVDVCRKEKVSILAVDDGSGDGSAGVVKGFDEITLVRHAVNRGYGAAIKTGVESADTDWIIMMDSDGQHDPLDIPRFLPLVDACDMTVGVRTGRITEPVVKALGRKMLRLITSRVCGSRVPDFNSGFRLFRKRVFMEFFDIYPDGFSISTTMMVAFLKAGYDVAYLPIETRARGGGP
ncbi:MAG: glycosyltransferase family 2 protein, partial [Pseudomonadota bacterium]